MKMNILILFGILLIINVIVVTGWWILGEHLYKAWAVILCSVVIFTGAILIFQGQNRAMELSNKWLGKIKAAASQATTDAETIAEIKLRIEAQSATVDLVSKSAAEAKSKLQELDEITEFSKTLLSAQSDDRRAFNKLSRWVDDKSFSMRKEAANAWVQIRADFMGPLEKGYMNFPWPKDVDPSKLSISELRKIYSSSDSIFHAGLVNFINEKSDISKKDRMAFFIDVLKDDESLIATSYAGKFFARDAGIEWKDFITKPLLDWWNKNKDKIE